MYITLIQSNTDGIMFHTYELDKCKEIIKEWEERTGLEMEQDDVKEVYLHYQDKFDLLDQIEQQLFADLGNHIDELQSNYSPTHTFEKEQEQLKRAFRSNC